MTMVNHPALVHSRHLDEFAALELDNRDLARVSAPAILDLTADEDDIAAAELREAAAIRAFCRAPSPARHPDRGRGHVAG